MQVNQDALCHKIHIFINYQNNNHLLCKFLRIKIYICIRLVRQEVVQVIVQHDV